MANMQAIKIDLPPLEPDFGIGPSCYVQSYREDGFRLEMETLCGKDIFHNYGQGGAEFSLAYGCAYMINKIMTTKKDVKKIRSVAVMGSGINAMFTALQLLKRGYKVTLYSQEVPTPESKYKTSQGRGLQFWYPGNYDNCDPLKHELLTKLSLEYFKECVFASRYQSLSQTDCFAIGPKAEQIRQFITEFIIEDIPQVQIDFGAQQLQSFSKISTLLIDTELLMSEIMVELQLRNIILEKKSFQSIEDVLSLKQQQIFNCLGIQNRQIFTDVGLKPIRSHYFDGKIGVKSAHNFVIWQSSQEAEEHDLVLYKKSDRLTIGGTWEQGKEEKKVEKTVADKLFAKAYHFVKQRTSKPMKL